MGKGLSRSTTRSCREFAPVAQPSRSIPSQSLQRRLFEGRDAGSKLRNPDFQIYARSFGVPSWRVNDAEGLRGALKEALAANAPALIEVMTDINQEYAPWEFIAPGRG